MSSFLYTNTLYLGIINYYNEKQTYQSHPPTVLKEELEEDLIGQLVGNYGLFTDEIIINKLKELDENLTKSVEMYNVISSNKTWEHVIDIMAPFDNTKNKLRKELNELDKFMDDNKTYTNEDCPHTEYLNFKLSYYLKLYKESKLSFEDFLKTLPNYGTVWDFEIKEITINTLYPIDELSS